LAVDYAYFKAKCWLYLIKSKLSSSGVFRKWVMISRNMN